MRNEQKTFDGSAPSLRKDDAPYKIRPVNTTAEELIKIPRLPAEAITGEPYRCSLCFQVVTVKGERAWRLVDIPKNVTHAAQ